MKQIIGLKHRDSIKLLSFLQYLYKQNTQVNHLYKFLVFFKNMFSLKILFTNDDIFPTSYKECIASNDLAKT